MKPMVDLLYKDEVYASIGAAMEVYNELGPGFVENIRSKVRSTYQLRRQRWTGVETQNPYAEAHKKEQIIGNF